MNDKKNPGLKREFLRAPFKATCLFVDGEYVLKARITNISEGGVLLLGVPHFPEISVLPMAFLLVKFPQFANMSLEELKRLDVSEMPSVVLKVQTLIARQFENQSQVDRVFLKYIGCEFCNQSEDFKKAVSLYVETFAKNIIYLLSLFEALGKKNEQIEILRTVANLLGYDRRMKIPLLRAKVLHDYQSLS